MTAARQIILKNQGFFVRNLGAKLNRPEAETPEF
jgi:hypothetical protein